jgi:hypothetical protein
MAKKQRKPAKPNAEKQKQAEAGDVQREVQRLGRILTSKDAGWLSTTRVVIPLTFVPIDPPRPLPKRRRRRR